MSMNHAGGKSAVRAQMDAVFGPISSSLLPAEQAALSLARDRLSDTIAEFVDYIQGSAVVNVASVSGVYPGAYSSGPGTGTIS